MQFEDKTTPWKNGGHVVALSTDLIDAIRAVEESCDSNRFDKSTISSAIKMKCSESSGWSDGLLNRAED